MTFNHNPGAEWDRARSLQQKMEDNLQSTTERMNELGRWELREMNL